MMSSTKSRIVGAIGITVAAFGISLAGSACTSERGVFKAPDGPLVGNEFDAGECGAQCSIDGRAVIRACDGEVIETCAEHLACGAGVCQDPCAAAAADRSSNGCEFYFQIPRYDTVNLDQSCAATFVVNT